MPGQRIILFATLMLFDSSTDVLDYPSITDSQQLVVDGFNTDAPEFAFRHSTTKKPTDCK